MILAVGVGTDVAAQEPRAQHVKHSVSCSACRVNLEQVAVLGNPADPEQIGGSVGLERDGSGRFFAVSLDRFRVVVFDSTGRYLTALGGKGDGPGEFGMSLGVRSIHLGPGDSLYVFSFPQRVSVFTPSLRYARGFLLPGGNSAAGPHVLRDGRIIIGARIPSPERIGLPYHIVDSEGVFLHSFGGIGRVAPGTPAPLPLSFVVSPSERSIWLVETVRAPDDGMNYQLVELALSNQRSAFEIADIPWMPRLTLQSAPGRRGGMVMRPGGGVGLAGVDSTGLVWVNGFASAGAGAGAGTQSNRVEVFDPRAAVIVVSQPVTHGIRFIDKSNLVYTVVADANDLYSYLVWRVELRGR